MFDIGGAKGHIAGAKAVKRLANALKPRERLEI